jgi:hypothetical protein
MIKIKLQSDFLVDIVTEFRINIYSFQLIELQLKF